MSTPSLMYLFLQLISLLSHGSVSLLQPLRGTAALELSLLTSSSATHSQDAACGSSLFLRLSAQDSFSFLSCLGRPQLSRVLLPLSRAHKETQNWSQQFSFKPHSSSPGVSCQCGLPFLCPGCPTLWYLSTPLCTRPSGELSATPRSQPWFLPIFWTLAYLPPLPPNFFKV